MDREGLPMEQDRMFVIYAFKILLGSNKNFRKPKNVKLIPANILIVLSKNCTVKKTYLQFLFVFKQCIHII